MMRILEILILSAVAAVSPETILKKTDEIRNPDDSFVMKVEVTSKDEDKRLFEVSLKGNDKTFIKTLEPKRDVGRDMLMLEENMWAYVPNLKRAVRINLGQKLSGQAANGDISRLRWADDYAAIVEKDEPKKWTLFLTAKKKGLTYDKIRAFVEKDTYKPLGAEFLTVDGKPLKKATFSEYKTLAGKERPSLLSIEDAIRPDQKSEIRILEMKVKALNDSVFTQERLNAR